MKPLVLVLLCIAVPAAADSDLVIVGPVATGKAQPGHVRRVKQALDQAKLAIAARAVDATCAGDETCLESVGVELGAKRLLAVTVAGDVKGGIGLGLALVDIAGKELVSHRDLVIAGRRLAADLNTAIKKFLDEAPTEHAKQLFQDGNQHYNLGEFASALELYKRAYRAKPLPAFQFNIAQCFRKLGKYEEAINLYQAYLTEVPDAQNKSVVESLIKESSDKLAAERDALAKQREEAAHLEELRIAAEKKQAEDARRAKEAEALAEMERHRRELARIEREREREKLYDRHPARKWTFVAAGVGVAALIAGGGFGLGARNAQSAFDDAGCGDPTRVLDASALAGCQAQRDRGKGDALYATGLLVGGGLLVATGVIVFAIDPGNIERPARVTVGFRW